MAKETYYFSHDYNARNDPKIKRLILKLGMAGYGVYWAIIEELYINANALPTDYECIAFDMRTECDVIKSIINDFELFVIDGDIFGSHSVGRRLNERNEKSIKAKESANKRWEKYERNANALQTQSDSNAIKERKGKEIKVKDSIEKEKKELPPSLDEFLSYAKFSLPGQFESIKESLRLKYLAWDANGWKDGHDKQIKNWKSKLLQTIPHLVKSPAQNNENRFDTGSTVKMPKILNP